MLAQVQAYLLQHGVAAIPGIGYLVAQWAPARYEVGERSFAPPACQVHCTPDEPEQFNLQQQVAFVARQLHLTEEEAFEQLHQWSSKVGQQLNEQGSLDLGALGILQQQEAQIELMQPEHSSQIFAPIAADRVLRQGAVHAVLVGDQEKTTAEMEAYYAVEEERPDKWWILPLVIGLLAVVLIVWKRYGQ